MDREKTRLFIEQAAREHPESSEIAGAILSYLNCSIPIPLTDEHREYFETEYPTYISYWGLCRFSGEHEYVELLQEDLERVLIPDDWIDRGLRLLAAEGYPRLGELLMGDYDAESLDALFQAGVLGERRYA